MEDKRAVVAEALSRWLTGEMHYKPEGKHSNTAPPNVAELRSLCRGVSLPFWDYVIHRVRSEKYVVKVDGEPLKEDDRCLRQSWRL